LVISKSAAFQQYHVKNKLHFDDDIALYLTNKLS